MVYFGVFFVLPNFLWFPDFYADIPDFYYDILFHLCTSVCRICMSFVGGAYVLCNQGGGWDVRLVKKRNNFIRVVTKLFGRAYFANPKAKPDSQSGYLY